MAWVVPFMGLPALTRNLPFYTVRYDIPAGWPMERTRFLDRLCRSLHLDVEPLGSGLYHVSGAGHGYTLHAGYPCPCPGFDRPCKHELALDLRYGDDTRRRDLLRSLRVIVPLPGARRLIRAA